MTENHPSAAEADLILGDYGTYEAVPLQRDLFFGKLWKPCPSRRELHQRHPGCWLAWAFVTLR